MPNFPVENDGENSKASKWHSFGSYLIRTDVTDSSVKIALTNSKLLWQTTLSKNELVTTAKNQNAVMEASDDRFLSAALELLSGTPSDIDYKVIPGEALAYVHCSIRSSLQGFSFGLDVRLEQANLEQYYKEISLPLLASIQELQNQQAELFKIIQAKDEEIGEYKLQGATLFRKSVATKYFNKEAFLNNEASRSNKISTSVSQFQPDTVLRNSLLMAHHFTDRYLQEETNEKFTTIKTELGTLVGETTVSQPSPPKRKPVRPESPVLPLSKRPKKSKLASLI